MYLFCWTQRKIFWRIWETEQFWGTIDFHSIFSPMEVNGTPKQPGYKLSSKYLPLCSAEQRNSYRFGTTWGGVNDDIIYICGWTIPLSCLFVCFLRLNICINCIFSLFNFLVMTNDFLDPKGFILWTQQPLWELVLSCLSNVIGPLRSLHTDK